jgi:hypothetical protein
VKRLCLSNRQHCATTSEKVVKQIHQDKSNLSIFVEL